MSYTVRLSNYTEWLAHNFGAPCDYPFKELEGVKDAMDAMMPGCHENCPRVKDKQCWDEFFRVRKDNDCMVEGNTRRVRASCSCGR